MDSSNNLLIFLHIPKCAGTTVRKHIVKNFRKSEYWDVDNDKKRPKNPQIIFGHDVKYGIHKKFTQKPYYFTFVRDPKSHIASYYNYYRTLYDREPQRAKNKQFYQEKLLIKGKVPEFDDWGRSYYDKPGMLKVAPSMARFIKSRGFKSDLSQFDFVGTVENFKEDSLEVYQRLGINKFFVNQNVSRNFVTKSDFSNSKDYQIYQKALSRRKSDRKLGKIRLKRKLLLPFTQVIFDFTQTMRRLYNKLWVT